MKLYGDIEYFTIINEILWHSPESNFTASAQPTILYELFE